MELFYREFGSKQNQPLIILHGLFGLSDNWVTFARRIAMEGYHVFVPDQRNHGQSPHSGNFNYLALTDDLFEFIDDHKIENPMLLGHSMGGKVAMRFTLENPEMVEKLIVVDISMKAYPPRTQHKKIIEAMRRVDLSQVKNRHQAEEELERLIPEKRIRLFVLKNLHRTAQNTFEWRLNIDGIETNLDDMFDAIETEQTFDKPALFIKGGASDYILPEDFDAIRRNFPHAEIITIAGASHWVHVEAPERFYQLTWGFFSGNPTWYKNLKDNDTLN
jgi:esterase